VIGCQSLGWAFAWGVIATILVALLAAAVFFAGMRFGEEGRD